MGLQRLDVAAFLALVQNLEDLGRALRSLRADLPILSVRPNLAMISLTGATELLATGGERVLLLTSSKSSPDPRASRRPQST